MSDHNEYYYLEKAYENEDEGDIVNAINNYKKMCSKITKMNDMKIMGYSRIAVLYSKYNNKKEAYEYINKINEISDLDSYLKQNLFECKNNIANVYIRFNDYQLAIECLNSIKNMEVDDYLKSVCINNLTICYLNTGDYNASLDYTKQYSILSDKIYEAQMKTYNKNKLKYIKEREDLNKTHNFVVHLNKLLQSENYYRLENFEQAEMLTKECINYFINNSQYYLTAYLNLVEIEYNNGLKNNNVEKIKQAKEDIDFVIANIRKSSTTDLLSHALEFKRDITSKLDSCHKDDILALMNDYDLSFDRKYNEEELQSLRYYVQFISYYHNILNQLDQNYILDLQSYGEMYEQFVIDYFDSKLDKLVKKDYIDLLRSKYLDVEYSKGSNNIYLQQLSDKINLTNIQNKLEKHQAILDIYQIKDTTIFIIIIQNDMRIYHTEIEVSNFFKKYNKVYVIADGSYHNTNLENIIPCDFIQITSFYTLFKENQYIIFTAADYGDRNIFSNIKVNNLTGTKVENKVFHDLFNDCISYVDLQFTKDNIISVESPKVLHISTHGFYEDINSLDKNKRYGLLLHKFNEGYSKEEYVLFPNDIEKMNLSHTELVFLNACQSGLSDSIPGQGIDGYRRAFSKAGVKYIICTITPIDDINAVIFTKAFYSKYKQYDNVEKAFLETKHYLKTKQALAILDELKPLFDDLDSSYIKSAYYHSKKIGFIARYDNGIYVKEDWSSFILHKY